MQTGDFEFKNSKGPPVVMVPANQPQFGIQNIRKHTRAEPSYHMHIFDSFKYFKYLVIILVAGRWFSLEKGISI